MSAFAAMFLTTLMAGVPGQQAPTIETVTPQPLPLGASVEVVGTDFVQGQTTVVLAGVNQNVVFTDAAKTVFVVSLATPLGPTTLQVTTPYGQATTDVEVAPAPPKIVSVTPDPLVLGELGTIQGQDLGAVTSVTLGDEDATPTSVTDTLVVFEVPLTAALLGQQTLRVDAASGYDVEQVSCAAPAPIVDKVSPNPSRAGDLVTIQGVLIGADPAVDIGAQGTPVVVAGDGELTVQVPPVLAPGAHEVVVTIAGKSSVPAGPLVVQAADPNRPEITAVVPSSAAAGGRVWLVGDRVEGATSTVPALTMEGCNQRGCAFSTVGLAPGVHPIALVTSDGTDVAQLQVTDAALVEPKVTGVSPDPVERGGELTIEGTDLFGVQRVLIGGVDQTVDFVDDTLVRVTIGEDTPLGAEPVFVAGGSASTALMVRVLAPLPQPDPDPVAETEPDAGPDAGPEPGPEPQPEATADAGAEPQADTGSVGGGAADDGCASGRASGPVWVLLALLLLVVVRRRA